MPLKDAIATVMNRNAFYRDGYRMLLRISIVQLAIIVLLIVTLVGMIFTVHTRQIYFATTSDGRLIPIVPLSEPYRSQADVVTWASSTAQDVMRFDYADFRTRLQQVSANFTPTGWDSFNKALKDSNILEAIQARKLVIALSLNAAPEITNAGVNNGVYTWDLRMPVTIKFDGAEPPQPIEAALLLRIVRVSTLQNTDGISIEQWVTVVPKGSEMTVPSAPAQTPRKPADKKPAPQAETRKGKEPIADDATEEARRKRLFRRLTVQSFVLLGLSILLIAALPFLQPIYQYAAVTNEGKPAMMAPLLLPNLTNRAITSWAATSVTEIMTLGFGDFDQRILKQRARFTKDGWDAFVRGFLNAKIDEAFRRNQLVLTTVPSDTPVITAQGPNENGVYQWRVQIPVVMTYATNNNVTRPERAVIDITILRVPYEENASGIAIETWKQTKGKGGAGL